MAPVRVLVVDDSALMRKHISNMLKSSSQIEVCGIASDGNEAVEKVRRLRPDVVTLDVDMPGRDGLETLPAILDICPTPVIMVSSLTRQGAQVTLDALDLGAVDFIPKPTSSIAADVTRIRNELVAKVLAVAGTPIRRQAFDRQRPRRPSPTPSAPVKKMASVAVTDAANDPLAQMCVAIGISTGGPPAIHAIFEKLVPPVPPIVVVQHMPAQFTQAFAKRLNELCEIEVKEAEDGDNVVPNRAIIAPGGMHAVIKKLGFKYRVALDDSEPVSGHKPSVDVLFASAAKVYGSKLVGVIMTGMGRDGADGCKQILANGGRTYGQDEATSVVYGMNKVAYREGGVQKQFPLDALPSILRNLVPLPVA
jgi:two-component system chemotaxis response regulator CheB